MSPVQDSLEPAVLRRLQEEDIVWFTTVSPDSRPTPNPVWFLWDGGSFLVFSQPESFRLRNIRHNPQVALTLQGVDGQGNNVVIINGDAELHPDNPSIPEAYWKKYRRYLKDMSPEEMTESYSVAIRVKPTRIRTE